VGTCGTGEIIDLITMPYPLVKPRHNQDMVWIRPTTPPSELSSVEDSYDNDEMTDLPDLFQQSDDSGSDLDSDEDFGNESDSDSEDLPPTKSRAILKYKKVSEKVRPIAMQIPEEMQPQRRFPEDPLRNLPILPHHPPIFKPTPKITAERMEELALDQHEELRPEELKLLQHILTLNERSIAFDENERGTFREEYFSDYVIPTVHHEPWIEKNIPLPQGYKAQILDLLNQKINAGVYERANTVYRAKWFCVKKKDGGLRIVHDLQRLNGVTIRDSSVPPIIEEFVEEYAGRSVYTVLDMYWGFHARTLDVQSRNLTAFQTPLGSLRLTSLPMGYANAPAEFQSCMMFILQDEIPNVAGVFIDDVPIKGPATRYLLPDGTEETIPQNPGIRRYIWEHLNDVNRILHRIGEAGGTVSAKKMQLCQAEVEIVGHQCSSKGREPVDSRVKKITNWPTPANVKEVRGFLGVCGTIRQWILDYSQKARPLVDLTRKSVDFVWGAEQEEAFQLLKSLASQAPALRPIDYTSDCPVILSVDTSIHGIGFILSQEDENGRRAPARYGSIPLKPPISNYGQSKLELYGLFRALRRFRANIVGVKKLIVEVDASSIRGMLHNPDIQASAVINRWIQGILQFDFELVHVPAHRHRGPDGLSRRRHTSQDGDSEESDPEEWVDRIALASRIQDQLRDSISLTQESEDQPTGSSALIPPPSLRKEDSSSEDETLSSSPSSYRYTDEDLQDILRYLVTNEKPKFRTSREDKRFQNMAKPFYLQEAHMYRRRPRHPPQVVIFPLKRRREILWEMHEDTAHHGIWAVEQQLTLRYFWPGMKDQIKKHVRSCDICQRRSTKKMHLPVTISHPATIFSKVYLDVMSMPEAQGKKWLVACKDDLSGATECKALARDTAKNICDFFLQQVILRYGTVQEVTTDNGPSFGKEFTKLANLYHIRHIKISAYNSQGNGVVERGHFNIREALVKLCKGRIQQWPQMVSAAVFADRITTRQATGYSPYWLLHGSHPLMPGDVKDCTFMVAGYHPGMTHEELITIRTRQLMKLPEDVALASQVLEENRLRSKNAYERKFARRLVKDSYNPGALVLVRNNEMENTMMSERKTADRYMGPYQIIRQTQGGSYILAEMNGNLLKHHVAAFRLIPYIQREDLDPWISNDESGSSQEDSENDSQGSSQMSD
jgi:hypothetical protein